MEEPDEEESDEEWAAHERFVETRAAEERFRERSRTRRRRRIQGAVRWMGLAAGVTAGLYARSKTSSWAVAPFVAAVVFWAFGFGLSRVVAKPKRGVRRFSYYAMGPLVATAVLYATYGLWGRWWLAVILGVLGAPVGVAAAARLFPSIAQEELEAIA